MASANPRGERKLVQIGEHNRKVKGSDGQSDTVTEAVLIRMFDDQIALLGWEGLITDAAQGKEIEAPNSNGTYQYDKLGVLGQQPIIAYLAPGAGGGKKKSVHFRVPYWFPNYKLTPLLKQSPNVTSYKRNGGKKSVNTSTNGGGGGRG